MNRLLELDSSNKLVIQPEALAIPAYADIWNRDETKHKDIAIKELSFIYFMCSIDTYNPYKEYDSKQRVNHIKEDLRFPKTWKVDEVIHNAIEMYKKHNYSATTDLLQGSLKGIHKLKDFFETYDLNERDTKTDKPVYKPKDITSALREVPGIVKSLNQLYEEELKQRDSDNGSKVRGGGRIGMFETK